MARKPNEPRRALPLLFSATGSRSLRLEVKLFSRDDAHFPPPPPPPPPAPSLPSLPSRGLGSLSPGAAARLSPLPPLRGGADPSVLAKTGEAAARGRAESRESRWSPVGGRRGSRRSRSASAGQTSGPALRGPGLRIGLERGPRRGRRGERRSLPRRGGGGRAGLLPPSPGCGRAADWGAQRHSLPRAGTAPGRTAGAQGPQAAPRAAAAGSHRFRARVLGLPAPRSCVPITL